MTAYVEMNYEPSELNGGKFAEVVVRILQWHESPADSYVPLGQHIRNLPEELNRLGRDSALPDSIRFHIPNAVRSISTIRNKRGVGHPSGDVDPNHMDAEFVVSSAKWILAELVRIFHRISPAEAAARVEEITVKDLPVVWDLGSARRVLRPFSKADASLVLLYAEHPESVHADALVEWVEHSNPTVYRKNVLRKLHTNRLINFDTATREVRISPLGIQKAEALLREAPAPAT